MNEHTLETNSTKNELISGIKYFKSDALYLELCRHENARDPWSTFPS